MIFDTKTWPDMLTQMFEKASVLNDGKIKPEHLIQLNVDLDNAYKKSVASAASDLSVKQGGKNVPKNSNQLYERMLSKIKAGKK